MEAEGYQHRTEDAIDQPLLAGKRILIVLGCLDLGGSERQAIQLADGLIRQQKAAVQVWGFRPPGRAAELCDQLGVPWRSVKEPWGPGLLRWPGMVWNLARLLRQQRPDILLPYTSFPNVVCGLAWRWTGARVCIWNQRDAGRNLDSPAAPWAIRNTPLFLSNSQVGAKTLISRFRVRPERVRVVRNGVRLLPAQRDRNQWRTRLEVGESCFLACMLANLHPYKDHATLLRAWRLVVDRLGQQRRTATLLLAGRLDAAEGLQALARELQLEDKVRFLGPVEDVSGLLAAVDLGVYCAKDDGCPNGVLECMAAGLPVVGADAPGIREAVGPAGFPWLAPPGDAAALADRIVTLAEDRAEATRLAQYQRERVERQFGIERMMEETASLFQTAWEYGSWFQTESQ